MTWPHRLTRGAGGRLFLIGPYDEELRAILLALPQRWRSWVPGLGAWVIADEAETIVRDLIDRHYMTDEQREAWRVRERLAWCERRLAALRAEKKAALREDWGI